MEKSVLNRTNNFEQGPLLQNIGNSIIVPAYKSLSDETNLLNTSVQAFESDPSQANLKALREQLFQTRLAWQACIPFQFGPAELRRISAKLNIYPVDQNQIERNITEGSYDLNALSNSDARGFPSLGYLLYSKTLSDEELLGLFDESRIQYLKEVTSEIQNVCEAVYDDWSENGGNHIAKFTSEDAFGMNVGSSVAQIINAWNITFERQVRDGKVGIPAGMRSNGVAVVENTEAYFAGYSVELLAASVDAFYHLYLGVDGVGFDDYLKEIGGTTTENEELPTRIETQFKTVKASVAVLSDPLPDQIVNDVDAVNRVFSDMQDLVLLFKTDMASTLGVVITYQDNDGD